MLRRAFWTIAATAVVAGCASGSGGGGISSGSPGALPGIKGTSRTVAINVYSLPPALARTRRPHFTALANLSGGITIAPYEGENGALWYTDNSNLTPRIIAFTKSDDTNHPFALPTGSASVGQPFGVTTVNGYVYAGLDTSFGAATDRIWGYNTGNNPPTKSEPTMPFGGNGTITDNGLHKVWVGGSSGFESYDVSAGTANAPAGMNYNPCSKFSLAFASISYSGGGPTGSIMCPVQSAPGPTPQMFMQAVTSPYSTLTKNLPTGGHTFVQPIQVAAGGDSLEWVAETRCDSSSCVPNLAVIAYDNTATVVQQFTGLGSAVSGVAITDGPAVWATGASGGNAFAVYFQECPSEGVGFPGGWETATVSIPAAPREASGIVSAVDGSLWIISDTSIINVAQPIVECPLGKHRRTTNTAFKGVITTHTTALGPTEPLSDLRSANKR
ncbi:MAG TPA: hypothetical protein VK760_08345 [Candidatus Acidoferrales bacterium]|jgi:hypothetical protein|nr:hypothetical protein [Candidatus Acidoferrales bacterium]